MKGRNVYGGTNDGVGLCHVDNGPDEVAARQGQQEGGSDQRLSGWGPFRVWRSRIHTPPHFPPRGASMPAQKGVRPYVGKTRSEVADEAAAAAPQLREPAEAYGNKALG